MHNRMIPAAVRLLSVGVTGCSGTEGSGNPALETNALSPRPHLRGRLRVAPCRQVSSPPGSRSPRPPEREQSSYGTFALLERTGRKGWCDAPWTCSRHSRAGVCSPDRLTGRAGAVLPVALWRLPVPCTAGAVRNRQLEPRAEEGRGLPLQEHLDIDAVADAQERENQIELLEAVRRPTQWCSRRRTKSKSLGVSGS